MARFLRDWSPADSNVLLDPPFPDLALARKVRSWCPFGLHCPDMHNTTLPLQHYLTAIHEQYRSLNDGQVATYIPELATADPDAFGICIVTADGHPYAVGDSDRHITMQSISKPAVYAAALADRGRAQVLRNCAKRWRASSSQLTMNCRDKGLVKTFQIVLRSRPVLLL